MSRLRDDVLGLRERLHDRFLAHQFRSGAARRREDALFAWLDVPSGEPPAGEVGQVAADAQALLSESATHLDDARKARMWKEIMMNVALIEPSGASGSQKPTEEGTTTGPRTGRLQRFLPLKSVSWASAMNATATLVLVVAVFAGFLSLRGRGPAPATPVHMATGLGTPTNPAPTPPNLTGMASPAASASTCTVKPLTVEEVMAKLTGRDPIVPLAPKSFYNKALTPEAGSGLGASLNEATLNDIARHQEMWLSCVMEGQWFQAWALESPDYLHREFTRLYFPVLDLNQVRKDLEALKDGATDTPFRTPVVSNGWIPVIVHDTRTAKVDWINAESSRVTVQVQWMTPDGKTVGPANEGLWPFWYTPNRFTYVRVKDGPWLLYDTEVLLG